MPLSRLLKFTEQNIAVQKQLHAQAISMSSGASSSKTSKAGPKDLGKSSISLGGSRKEGTRGTKRGREEVSCLDIRDLNTSLNQVQDDGTKRPDLRLNVPETLKVLLVDDWEAVTKNSQVMLRLLGQVTDMIIDAVSYTFSQLVCLPRSPNVQDILQDFSESVTSLEPPLPQHQSLLPTIIAGLQLYFDRSIGANLLYRFERPQYAEVRKKYVTGQEKEMSLVYGTEHLLRMLGVNLPVPFYAHILCHFMR